MAEVSVDTITRICDWSLCHRNNVTPESIRHYFATHNITVNPKSSLGIRMQLFDLYASPDVTQFDALMASIHLEPHEILIWMEVRHRPVTDWAAFLSSWENRVIPRPNQDLMALIASIDVTIVDRPSRNSIIFSTPDRKRVSQVIFEDDDDDDKNDGEISTPPTSESSHPHPVISRRNEKEEKEKNKEEKEEDDDDPFMDEIFSSSTFEGPQNKKPRKYEHWTQAEDQALMKGLERYGHAKWSKMMSDAELKPILHRRDATKLKDRVRNLEKAGKLPAHLVKK